MAKNQDANRRKLLKLLSREQLERLSHRERPWLANRADLEADILSLWQRDAEDIRDALNVWINRAFE